MIADALLPPGCPPPATAAVERHGVLYTAARWTPGGLAELVDRLAARGPAALASLSDDELLAGWAAAVEAFRDPASPVRRELDPILARLTRLSPEGLAAGLEAVLGGVREASARRLLAERGDRGAAGPVLVLLAANLPALAVQPLLPALVLRRPVLLKSPTAEPIFAPAFLRELTRRLPALADAVGAVTWPGGDRALEAPPLAAAATTVAYGEEEALADLRQRAPGKLVEYGPKVSLAVIGRDVDPAAVASGLARDVALFDQRGCLSVHAVYTLGDAAALAAALGEALAERARHWPPGPPDAATAAGVQQLRLEAGLRALATAPLPVEAGTVVVEPEPPFQPSPGLRTVRIHPVTEPGDLRPALKSWAGRLQGAAVAGAGLDAVRTLLGELGVSRISSPGELQTPDAAWHNGGVHPLEALSR